MFAPVHFKFGIQGSLPYTFKSKGGLKTDNLNDYKDIINLLENIPKQIDQIIDLLVKGISKGMTFHEASMSRTPKQFEILLNYEKIENSDFYKPFADLVGNSSEIVELQEKAKKIIHHKIRPAYEKLKAFLNDEYSKHLRKFPGISSLNNNIYLKYLEYHTTIKGITPEEIHNKGLDEIQRLKSELLEFVQDEMKLNMTFPILNEYLRKDEKNKYHSKKEVIDHMDDLIK